MNEPRKPNKNSAVFTIARIYSIPLLQDFETLSDETVARLAMAADAVKYKESKNDAFERARSFYAVLNSGASENPPSLDVEDAKTVGEYFFASFGVAIRDEQDDLRDCPLDCVVGIDSQEIIDTVRHLIRLTKNSPDETGETELQMIGLANDLCLTLMYG